MPLDFVITTERISHDPIGREFVEHLQQKSGELGLDDGVLYYDFPTYSDYETVAHKPDALLLSGKHGVLAIRFVAESALSSPAEIALRPMDESLTQFCSILIGRLLRSKSLRRDRSSLLFPVTPIILVVPFEPKAEVSSLDSVVIGSLGSFDAFIIENALQPISREALDEMRSVVEGAKAITRPQKRVVEDPQVQRLAAALSRVEAEIANFDQQQRRAALVQVPGPQRIRGLAGSGKTIILAMKAAHLHLSRPDERILVTFYTRNLRALLKNLITRFFRHYKDEDPDWSQIHILHAWGGSNLDGTYADACRRSSLVPLSFTEARKAAPFGVDPFDFACRDLLNRGQVEPYYDHVLIDEGQDFRETFYELCFNLCRGKRDSKNIVWAYDELQNIFDVQVRSPEQLFGIDEDGEPRISLERSARNMPPGAANDTVLSKCYRNQREVLVTAHALGFGIYGEIVQLLQSPEHWQDVGYEVLSPDYRVGEPVQIRRPEENSPVSLDQPQAGKIIDYRVAATPTDEVEWIVAGILDFLVGGLQPEDIVVITLDDRNARTYFNSLSSALAQREVETNNILADPYSEPPFTIPGKVTLSTVYRAKGNEAAVVFALGADAVVTRTRAGRNKLFTAFTRSKAWLRVSGTGSAAAKICREIDEALAHFPDLEFTMPDLEEVELIQRDLSERSIRAKRIRDEYFRRLRDEGFRDDEILDILSVEVKSG